MALRRFNLPKSLGLSIPKVPIETISFTSKFSKREVLKIDRVQYDSYRKDINFFANLDFLHKINFRRSVVFRALPIFLNFSV
jgi:hypothetical protein